MEHYAIKEKNGRTVVVADEGYRLNFGGKTYPKMRFCAVGSLLPAITTITEEEYQQIRAEQEKEIASE